MATSGTLKLLSRNMLGNVDEYTIEWHRHNYSLKDNTTTIAWVLYYSGGSGGMAVLKQNLTVKVDNTTYTGALPAGTYWAGKDRIMSGYTTVNHNNDGSKTVYFELTEASTISSAKRTDSATITLDSFNYKAEVLSATAFNDEESPTITYSNPAGEAVTSLQACISFDGRAADIPYRDISKTGTSYTFALTDAERATLRKKIADGNSIAVRFYVKTIAHNTTYYSYITQTLTFINYTPTLAPTVKDVNARTLSLTGDQNTFIKYHSTAEFNVGAAGRKGASIEYNTITCGSTRLDDYASSTGTIEGVDSNTFYFSTTDTRGDTERSAVVVDLVPYVKLTSSLSTSLLGAKGELTFTVKGKYYNGSFGAKNNSMEVEYSLVDGKGDYVLDGSGWQPLGTVQPIVDSKGNYEYSYTITGLDYTQQYRLSVNVIDELTPVITNTTVVRAIPLFDWGEDDFHHHTDIYIDNGNGVCTEGSKGLRIELLSADGYGVKVGSGDGAATIRGNPIYLNSDEGIFINKEELADFVVEQGSNSYWFYRKWNGGRVELYGYNNINNELCNTALGGWYRTAVFTAPAFPFTVNNPKVTASYDSEGYGALVWFTTRASSSKPGSYYLIRPTSSSGITGVVNYHCSGTWK